MKDRLAGARPRRCTSTPRAGQPDVWLFVGVNGVGKTTTIGKVAAQQAAEGRSVVLAAGDTFRAAAAEQLGTWAERAGADFVRGNEGGDPSAVIFDAVAAGRGHGVDLVLADTAGRLHTKTNLMEELRKVRRVADQGAGHVTEVLLVIDATTGQNGLHQARQFAEADRGHRRGAHQARRLGQGRHRVRHPDRAGHPGEAGRRWARRSPTSSPSTPTSSSTPCSTEVACCCRALRPVASLGATAARAARRPGAPSGSRTAAGRSASR